MTDTMGHPAALLVLVLVTLMAASFQQGLAITTFEQCTMKPEIGRCRALMRRFYFDPVSNVCKVFYYGGCNKNANNFQSLYECRLACQPRFQPQFKNLIEVFQYLYRLVGRQ